MNGILVFFLIWAKYEHVISKLVFIVVPDIKEFPVSWMSKRVLKYRSKMH